MSVAAFDRRRVGVICGGWSSEREISLRSGTNVAMALRRLGYDTILIDLTRDFPNQIRAARIDVAFIILHGKPGEDGSVQGCLELLGIPYTGSGIEASAIALDKVTSKLLFQATGIPTPNFVPVCQCDNLDVRLAQAETTLAYPMIVKPRFEGSSVGLQIVTNLDELRAAAQRTRTAFGDFFIEEYIKGMIATVGILGERVLPVLELVPREREFYDYHAKYTPGETEFVIPARLAKHAYEQVQELAMRCHQVIGCTGFSRVDLVVRDGRQPYFLEVNTLPGMTDVSDLPAQAAHVGISYDELVREILRSAHL